jgi:hypothetical protein
MSRALATLINLLLEPMKELSEQLRCLVEAVEPGLSQIPE